MSGIVVSVNIAGLAQFLVPAGSSLQAIRIEQAYGFVAITLLFLALLASPLTKAFPNAPYNAFYLHARRAIGVLTFYYAFLHVCISFFVQLGGFSGIKYYSSKYELAIILGLFALTILFAMAATSLDLAVKVMTYRRWKLLHRLVYGAGLAIIVHVLMIGSHYSSLNVVSVLTAVIVILLLRFEIPRVYRSLSASAREGGTLEKSPNADKKASK